MTVISEKKMFLKPLKKSPTGAHSISRFDFPASRGGHSSDRSDPEHKASNKAWALQVEPQTNKRNESQKQ